jgi:hypothetical protein
MSEHTVTVWGKPHQVIADRLSKYVWRASGDYEGKPLETRGRSERVAVSVWRVVAKRISNP